MRIGAVQRKRYRNKINLTPKIGAVVVRPLRFFAHGQHEIILHKQRIYIKEAMFKGIAADIKTTSRYIENHQFMPRARQFMPRTLTGVSTTFIIK